MEKVIKYGPRLAFFLAGIAAGALAGPRRERNAADASEVADLKRALAALESRLAAQAQQQSARIEQLETRVDDHDAKLAAVPSTAQIVAAMERLLSGAMASLDERLATQAHSIEILKTTVSQTDGLLERVLESLDTLQSFPGSQAQPEGIAGRSAM
jgi:chromosome segregation ATPase